MAKHPVIIIFKAIDLVSKNAAKIINSLERVERASVKASRAMEDPLKRMERSAKRMKNIAGGFSALGAGLAYGISMPLQNMAIDAVKTSATFQDVMAEIAGREGLKLFDDKMQSIQERIRAIGKTNIFGATQTGQTVLSAMLAGFDIDRAIEAADRLMSFAAAERITPDLAATGIVGIMNAYGLESKDANIQLQNLIKTTDRFTKATALSGVNAETMFGSLKAATGFSQLVNVGFDEMAGLISGLSKIGLTGNRPGYTGRHFMATILGNEKAIAQLQELGLTWKDIYTDETLTKARPIDAIISRFAELNLTPAQIVKIFNKHFGGDIALMLKRMDVVNGVIRGVREGSENAVENVKAERMKTFTAQTQLLASALEELKLSLTDGGENSILNKLSYLVGRLTDLVKWFSELSPQAKNTMLLMAGLAWAFGIAAAAIGTLSWAYLGLKAAALAADISIGAVLGRGLLIGGWSLAIVAAIAYMAFWVNEHWEDIGLGLDILWGKMKDFWDWCKSKMNIVPEFINKGLEAVGSSHRIPTMDTNWRYTDAVEAAIQPGGPGNSRVLEGLKLKPEEYINSVRGRADLNVNVAAPFGTSIESVQDKDFPFNLNTGVSSKGMGADPLKKTGTTRR